MSKGVFVVRQENLREVHTLSYVLARGGGVSLEHEISYPETGEAGNAEVVLPSEKARELAKMLIDCADRVERESAKGAEQ